MRKIAGNDKELVDIVKKLEKLNKDKFFGALYNIEEENKKWIRTKEEELKEAKEEGIAEGKEVGIAEGKAEGIAEGKAEEKANIATKLIAKGSSLEEVSEITGLSKEDIEKLEV